MQEAATGLTDSVLQEELQKLIYPPGLAAYNKKDGRGYYAGEEIFIDQKNRRCLHDNSYDAPDVISGDRGGFA